MHTIPYSELKKLSYPFEITSRKDWIVIILVGSLVGIAFCWNTDFAFARYVMPPAMVLYYTLNLLGDRNLLKALKKDLLDPHAGNSLLWDIYLKKLTYRARLKQAISLEALRNPADLFILGRLIQCHGISNQEDENRIMGEAMVQTAVSYSPQLQAFLNEDNLGEVLRRLQ